MIEFVMAGLVPAIHVFPLPDTEGVDARMGGHDGEKARSEVRR